MYRLALAVLSLALTGCAALIAQMQSANRSSIDDNGVHHVTIDGRMARVGPYWGPECVRIGADHNTVYDKEAEATMGKQPNLSHNPEDQVLRLVCVENILSSETEPERNTWVMQHFRFDELYFDHFSAALMLVQCLKAGSCLNQGAVRVHRTINNRRGQQLEDEQEARGPQIWQFYEVGMMRWYADHVDPAAVAQRLAKLPLPPAAQQAFLALLDRARAGVVTMTDLLAPEPKRLFVELPASIYTARAKARAKSDKLVAEAGFAIDQMKTERAGGGVTDETITKLGKLRQTYAASCPRSKDCTRDTIFAELTTQLFWAHVARGDAPAARAESKLLEHLEPTAAQELAEKQSEAVEKARGRLSRVSAAREQGVDADAARSTAQGNVIDWGDGRYVYRWHDDFKIYWETLVPEAHELAPIDGKVAALDRKGNEVTIRFQDVVSTWSESTNCYETNRIDGIDSDGRIRYRQECNGSTTRSERHKTEPMTMPASEAAGIGPGDEVSGFSRLGPKQERVAGRIWFVKRGQRIVRLRDVPL